jgi:type IV pilus assembly protein PilN
MLVDINLLPQKQKRKSSGAALLMLALLLIAAIGTYGWFIYQNKVKTMESLEQQLTLDQKLKAVKKSKAVKNTGTEAVSQLKSAIDWAKETPVSTFLLMRNISSLLPERGYILQFSYEDKGKAQLSVQFDSSRQAAYYLKSLSDSKYIEEAKFVDMTTMDLNEGNSIATEQETDEVLPRYVARYDIVIDTLALKEAAKKEEVSK